MVGSGLGRDRNGGLWSRADVGYVLDWLRCARQNGLAVSYIGGWNEHFQGTPVQRAWFVNLRAALDAAGFTGTQIVAADEIPQLERNGRTRYSPLLAWRTIAADMVTDPSFGRAVSVLGVHDTCGLPTTGYRCVMPAGARTLAARLANGCGRPSSGPPPPPEPTRCSPARAAWPARSTAFTSRPGSPASWYGRSSTRSSRAGGHPPAVPPPGAALIARFRGFRRAATSQFRGYELTIRGNGAWQVVANGPAAVTLASGIVASGPIYTLSLTTHGTTISAQINGVRVATVSSRAYRYGPAGLGSLGYYPVRYLSFTVR